ncbi:MAG: hypothetical protein EA367_04050 [Leptolyngbya sp. DLM2.Bin15]|nr:MAG: hypothetical protein EA367_04050 [Leptolyngbya sp. DLM2.Bin15]
MRPNYPSNWLFNAAINVGKYTILFVFGGTLFSLISITLGVLPVAEIFIFLIVVLLWRVALIALCLLAAGILVESFR